MALAISNTLANGSVTNKSSGQTHTFSPTVNVGDLVLICFRSQSTSGTGSISGITSSNGETLTLIETVNHPTALVLFCVGYWFVATATAPTITVTMGGAGLTYNNAQWCVDLCTGYDPATPIRQHAQNGGDVSNLVVTLGSAPLATGITWGGGACNTVPANIAPTAGWTQLGEFDTAEPNRSVFTSYKANSQTSDWTFTSGPFSAIGLSAEIQAVVASNRQPQFQRQVRQAVNRASRY